MPLHVSISAVSLTISPKPLEDEFWARRHVTRQLLQIDRFAFLMSTLNLYTGWCTAGAVASSAVSGCVMRVFCLLFFLLSLGQQFWMQRRAEQYLKHRNSIILATRLARGAWMLLLCITSTEGDISGYIINRKLENGVSQTSMVLQLLMLVTLVFLGQCLYWPLPFKTAWPLQLAYVGTSLAGMRSMKCALATPAISDGTQKVCSKVTLLVDGLGSFLSDGRVPAVAGMTSAEAALLAAGGSSKAGMREGGVGVDYSNLPCTTRSNEELLYFWVTAFGLLLPLYVLYVRELSSKQEFVLAKQRQHEQQHAAEGRRQQLAPQPQPDLGGVVKMGPLLHAAAVAVLVLLGSVGCELLLLLLPPPSCG